MKDFLAAVLLTVIFLEIEPAAKAAWLLDGERYHVSVHGRLACLDCHSDIDGKERHPDPVDVNRSLEDFFRADQCAACHEDTASELAEGRHAGQPKTPWQDFENCLACHDPHYQIGESEDAVQPDLNRSAAIKCSLCHEFQSRLPGPSEEDRTCLECHLAAAGDDPAAVRRNIDFCLDCHDAAKRLPYALPLIDAASYRKTPHREVACLVCHPQAAAFGHSDQAPANCGQCHLPHNEKVAHDLHAAVSCGACHLKDVVPVRDPVTRHVLWRRPAYPDGISPIHQMEISQDKAFCRSCHIRGNTVGAAAMVLPAKSIICMPCHAATLSVGDAVTVLSLVFFGVGMILIGSVWFSGGAAGAGSNLTQSLREAAAAVFSSRIRAIIGALMLDGLLQRRLFRASKERWLLHALIFYPFLFRFIWGILALTASLQWPQWPTAWAMLDKNNALTAFLFDLSGMMIIIGVIGMVINRLQKRSDAALPGLPAPDWPAYALLGGIMAAGFVLEGMRMAMTGSPDGASYAFIGDAVSRLLSGFDLTGIYGYIWYLHAILSGAFIVYLPFSRMLHMIMAPVVLAMKAAHAAAESKKDGKP